MAGSLEMGHSHQFAAPSSIPAQGSHVSEASAWPKQPKRPKRWPLAGAKRRLKDSAEASTRSIGTTSRLTSGKFLVPGGIEADTVKLLNSQPSCPTKTAGWRTRYLLRFGSGCKMGAKS